MTVEELQEELATVEYNLERLRKKHYDRVEELIGLYDRIQEMERCSVCNVCFLHRREIMLG